MDDNTYECPNCGAQVYPEQTRCSQCGHNMYPEDEQVQNIENAAEGASWGAVVGGFLIGWMIAAGITLIIHFIVAAFVSPSNLSNFGAFILISAAIIGSMAGAYISAGLNKRSSIILGGLIGILALPISILLATHWVKVTASLLLSPLCILAGLLIVAAGAAGGWLNQLLTQNTDWKEKWQVRGWEDLLYQDLLRKVRFNGSAADRLIEYERKQDPQAGRLKLIQNAIERWERDNR